MIRKQLYLEEKQQAKLRALARRWGCTEAEVMRKAIDRLADPDDLDSLIVQRLSEAGLLVPPRDEPDLPPPDKAEEWEKKEMEWLDSQPPMGLGEAVLEERRSGW
jgi:hypothetical protein